MMATTEHDNGYQELKSFTSTMVAIFCALSDEREAVLTYDGKSIMSIIEEIRERCERLGVLVPTANKTGESTPPNSVGNTGSTFQSQLKTFWTT